MLKDGTGFALGQAVTWKTENNRLYITHPSFALVFDYKLSGTRVELTDNDRDTYIYINFRGGASELVGTWESPYEESYTFNKDGTGEVDGNEFKWATENGMLYSLYDGRISEAPFEIKGRTLTFRYLSAEEEEMYFNDINNELDELVDSLGSWIEVGGAQPTLWNIIDYNGAIAAAVIYSGNGLIMGHYIPDRVGKMLLDVDTQYGDQMNPIYQAVINGTRYDGSYYSAVLATDIQFVVLPFQMGSSDTTWSIMIGTPSYFFNQFVKTFTKK